MSGSKEQVNTGARLGHQIEVATLDLEEALSEAPAPCGDRPAGRLLSLFERGGLSALVIRNFLETPQLDRAQAALNDPSLSWRSPNQGMPGGEIRTIGAAATPTFTALQGPSVEDYLASEESQGALKESCWGSFNLNTELEELLSTLSGGATVAPPSFEGTEGRRWLPFNYRALDPGVQIYAHHDQHYRLPIYGSLSPDYDRESAISWFLTLQAPEAGGELILYGLWGDDPNPPMLPTRFVDIEALERDYHRAPISLSEGDLVLFDSGRFVHRVSPVVGARPRLSVGGFLTFSRDQRRIAYWS